ncbi:beta-glucosidase [Ilumatobacter coccineus YM16-304]|uniref:Beta-glucosidase n=1 Tax=Ilumatobacter coccineus (strain NBRC 103263 / KCTC 29153 / YM16-304) TaxID=1313172 RepID=A0A6C7EB32_ILUCY|nr:beta-glucosidase [Ilumatobacter coccineus YM16-304]
MTGTSTGARRGIICGVIDIDAALNALSLADKCRLVAGETNWRTKAFPEAGIPQLKMSDGPTGIRGEGHGSAGTPGVAVPAGITLGASWDPDLLGEIGDLLGREAVRKRAHVLLGPTVNLHRTPIGGRTFECYSEDPELSGALAASYVRAVQRHDVAVTVKHFVCNDTEIDRMTVDVDVDERPLRELYLRPFERAVKEGGAWGIMTAYNRVAGEFAAQNRRLLTDILRGEWGFDGFAVSDWFGVHEPVGAANAGLTLEMPAPVRVYGDRLLAAIEAGSVTEETVDGLVRDLLGVMNRTKADERNCDEPELSIDDPAERALTRRAAIGGTVLLRNEPIDSSGHPVLPVALDGLASMAVIGPNAVIDRSMGGGSASLTPFDHRTLLDALSDRVGPDTDVRYEPGVRIDRLTPIVRSARLRTPDGADGLRLEYVNGTDWDAPATIDTVTSSSMIRFFGTTPDEIDATAFGARVSGSFVPEIDGPHEIGVVSTGPVTMTARTGDGDPIVVVDDPDMLLPRTREFFGYGSEESVATVECRAGEPVHLEVKWRTSAENGFAALRIGVRPPEPSDLIDRAVAAAAEADVAVVVVGTNDEWETEGFDREVMSLPGRQDELVERVVAANPNTVVVVNAGSPVSMDWAADDHPRPAAAIVTSFFAGQEQAEAMVDVLTGVADPAGRLPITYPQRLADTPAFEHHEPVRSAGRPPQQRYAEGLFIGHRHYEANDVAPRFWLGHGLSYGSVEWSTPTASRTSDTAASLDDSPIVVSLSLTNTSDRDATSVVQCYVAPIAPSVERPVRELKAWAKESLPAQARRDVSIELGSSAFRHWDEESGAWKVEPGEYDIVVATSADPDDEHERLRITIT